MPQTNVLPDWVATYPRDAAAQKPGGVTISTTLIANAVPNKPQLNLLPIPPLPPGGVSPAIGDAVLPPTETESPPESTAPEEEAPTTRSHHRKRR
jgi:hypothetical protein